MPSTRHSTSSSSSRSRSRSRSRDVKRHQQRDAAGASDRDRARDAARRSGRDRDRDRSRDRDRDRRTVDEEDGSRRLHRQQAFKVRDRSRDRSQDRSRDRSKDRSRDRDRGRGWVGRDRAASPTNRASRPTVIKQEDEGLGSRHPHVKQERDRDRDRDAGSRGNGRGGSPGRDGRDAHAQRADDGRDRHAFKQVEDRDVHVKREEDWHDGGNRRGGRDEERALGGDRDVHVKREEGQYDGSGRHGGRDEGRDRRDDRDRDRRREDDSRGGRPEARGGRDGGRNDRDDSRLPPPPGGLPLPPPRNMPPPPSQGDRSGRSPGSDAKDEASAPAPPKVEPNLGLSGKLAEETNKVGGVVLKHQPPPDAAKPDRKWRLYVFKDGDMQDEPLYLHRMDHYLFGRDFHVADVVCAHPSISKQHAVLQYRKTSKQDEFGLEQTAIRPYLMDLGTVNGTFLNGERLEPQRFYELLLKDSIKFGMSSREYLLLHEEASQLDA